MSQGEYKRDRHEKSKLPEELDRNLLEERFRSNRLLTVALLTVYLRSQARACLSANAVESPRLKCQHLPAYMLRPSTCPNLPVSDRNLSNSDMGVGHSILWLSKKETASVAVSYCKIAIGLRLFFASIMTGSALATPFPER